MKNIIEKIYDRYVAYGLVAGFILPLMGAFAIIVFISGAIMSAKNKNEYTPNGINTTIFVDSETGVNYIIYKRTSITVRYNADGSVYISEKDSN